MSIANPYESSSYFSDDESSSTRSSFGESFDSDAGRPLDGSDLSRSSVPSEKLSVLGPTVAFRGELTANEDLMIQGQIEGSIRHHAQLLTIGPKGKVKADIHANHIIIQGEVHGDLFGTEAIIIEASARVRGNVFAPRVALKEGAKFKGNIDMDVPREQPKSSAPPSRPASQASLSSHASQTSQTSQDATPDSASDSKSKRRRGASGKDTVSDTQVNELLE